MDPKIFEAVSMLKKCTDPKSVLKQWLAEGQVSKSEYDEIMKNL